MEPRPKGPKDPVISTWVYGSSYVGSYLGEYIIIRSLHPWDPTLNPKSQSHQSCWDQGVWDALASGCGCWATHLMLDI